MVLLLQAFSILTLVWLFVLLCSTSATYNLNEEIADIRSEYYGVGPVSWSVDEQGLFCALGVAGERIKDSGEPLQVTPESRHHKNLFPFSSRDAIGFSLAIVGLMIAAGGGIGGGGILVPIYILVLQFLAKNAIPLSNVTVFGGAVANTLLNMFVPDDRPHRVTIPHSQSCCLD